MAENQADDLPVLESTASPCCHLRSKGMYVYADATSGEFDADDDHSVYWCQKTMKNFGPDDDMVGGRECRDASRSCYESI
jgi:hypothetical protein